MLPISPVRGMGSNSCLAGDAFIAKEEAKAALKSPQGGVTTLLTSSRHNLAHVPASQPCSSPGVTTLLKSQRHNLAQVLASQPCSSPRATTLLTSQRHNLAQVPASQPCSSPGVTTLLKSSRHNLAQVPAGDARTCSRGRNRGPHEARLSPRGVVVVPGKEVIELLPCCRRPGVPSARAFRALGWRPRAQL
jgi:hypothetical protein